MTSPYPQVKCRAGGILFESQVKIDPAVYAMYPNLRIGGNTFTCPQCGQRAEYSEREFLYTQPQAAALARFGREVEARNVLVLPPSAPKAPPVVWVAPLTERLIRIVHDSRDWSSVSPRQLEAIVAELLAEFGYEVELTKRTRDGGRDVIAIGHSMIKDNKYLIECKHQKDRVGIGVVRELLGVGRADPNSGLLVVSVSGFTKDARLLADKEEIRWLLQLKDAAAIEEWITSYARSKGWEGRS